MQVSQQFSAQVQIRNRIAQTLLSWPFLLSLALLIANDVYLKFAFSNWITGKLSDVAGIYFVALLAFAVWPGKKREAAMMLSVAFLFWKSPASQWVIDNINSVSQAQIGRVVDYSDLLALIAIPFAWITVPNELARPPQNELQRFLSIPIAAITCLAVMGTSVLLPRGEYSVRNTDGHTPVEQSAFVAAIERVTDQYGLQCGDWEGAAGTAFCFSEDLNLWYTTDEAANEIRFQIEVTRMKGVFLPDPDYDLFESFLRDLKAELGQLSPSMEFVQDISSPPKDSTSR